MPCYSTYSVGPDMWHLLRICTVRQGKNIQLPLPNTVVIGLSKTNEIDKDIPYIPIKDVGLMRERDTHENNIKH